MRNPLRSCYDRGKKTHGPNCPGVNTKKRTGCFSRFVPLELPQLRHNTDNTVDNIVQSSRLRPGKRRGERAEGFGFNVAALLEHFGASALDIALELRAAGLPAPTERAVLTWMMRGKISPNWLAVLLLALKRRGVVLDLSEFARGPQ